MSMRIWPMSEQPRERLLSDGPEGLSDADILAVLIRTGYQGRSAVSLSRSLIKKHGGLRQVLDLDGDVFCQEKGLGPVTYSQLQACLELGRRYLDGGIRKNDVITNSASMRRYLRAKLRHQTREIFACIFLDTKNHIIQYQEVFFGTVDCAAVYPREVLKLALRFNASAVIFAHNHPSGSAEPSYSDKEITHTLTQALELVDIKVLDHVIVGDLDEVSFAEKGLM